MGEGGVGGRGYTGLFCFGVMIPYWETEGYGVNFGFDQYVQTAEIMRTCKVMVNINDHPDIRRVFDGFHSWRWTPCIQ